MSARLEVRLEMPLDAFTLTCDFKVENEAVVLFGHSGAGKSSILECLAGFRQPCQGELTLNGRTLFSRQQGVSLPVRDRHIGYLSQQPALFPHLSVRQNVEYGLLDMPRDERAAKVESALERFQIAPLASRRPAAISGGEQQRVALARTLVREPELLLLDEPLSALDHTLKSLLLETIFEWRREHGVPMLYVTHDQAEAYSLARRVLVMERGSILADGEPERVLRTPLSLEHAALIGCENIFEALVEERHEEQGTMRCRLRGSELALEAPLVNREPGDHVRLALRAGDILVATSRPEGISARNLFEGEIAAVEGRAGLEELLVSCSGISFRVHITRGSWRNLGLMAGQRVWMVVKTHSIQLLRQPEQA